MTTAKNVMVIPARRRLGNTVQAEERPKLRVAAYCRVSTDSDEQATSYEAQVEHYTAFIKQNSEWEFAGIFADDKKKRRILSGCNKETYVPLNIFSRSIPTCCMLMPWVS